MNYERLNILTLQIVDKFKILIGIHFMEGLNSSSSRRGFQIIELFFLFLSVHFKPHERKLKMDFLLTTYINSLYYILCTLNLDLHTLYNRNIYEKR